MNSNVGVVSVVAISGPTVMVTSGGVVSPISQLYSAGDPSMLPAGPTAWTRKSCAPIGRFSAWNEVPWHAASVRRSESRAHLKVEPAMLEENVNVTSVLSVTRSRPMFGTTDTIVVWGGSLIVHV